MTVDEFRRCIDAGGAVECENALQRGEAIQFLIDIGYEIHPGAEEWLEENPESPEFLHPGLDNSESKITCWRWIEDKQVIPFGDIEELLAKSDLPIDERSSEEFSEAFMALMS